MSAAATAGEAPAKKGSKKLIIIIAAVVLVVLAGGGGALFMMKKKAAAAEAEAEAQGGETTSAAAAHGAAGAHKDPAHPPTFVPLEPFTVNLADKDSERYAQIGITLQVDDTKFADQMKGFMPAIRSGILMVLAHKTAAELLTAEGKAALSQEIMAEAVRPMGIEIDDHDSEDDSSTKKKKKKKAPPHNPVEQVHFSSFIIQ